MQDGLIRPAGLIEPEAVLRETGKVYYSEIRTPGRSRYGSFFRKFLLCFGTGGRVLEIVQNGQIMVIWSRLAEIVISGPDKFTEA